MKRCLVAPGVYMQKAEGGGIRPYGTLTVQDLNYYSLYWDEIVIPTTSAFHFALPNEHEYEELGIITRPELNYFNTDGLVEKYLEFQIEILNKKRVDERASDWSLHQIGRNFVSNEENNHSKLGVRFEIFNALPIPNAEVPLADILEFKARKQQVFDDFHGYLDDIYKQVKYSPEDPLLKSQAYFKFEKSLENIRGMSDEKWRGKLDGYKFSWGYDSPRENIEAMIDGIFACLSFSSGDYASATKDVISIAAKGVKVKTNENVMLGSEKAVQGMRFLVDGYKEGIF